MNNQEYLADLRKNLSGAIKPNWRVQSFSKRKAEAIIICYIDARDVQDMLNQYCTYGWHREHYILNSDVYCRIGIVMPDGSVQYRADVGTPAKTEIEKSKASDSFKRAAVNWGIGRSLYETEIVRVTTNEIWGGDFKNTPYVVDDRGNRVWDLTKHVNNLVEKGKLTITNLVQEIS